VWERTSRLQRSRDRSLRRKASCPSAHDGEGLDRANVVGDWSRSHTSRADLIQRYFNTAAFQANAMGNIGNSGRNILTAPGSVNLDVSLSKAFRVRERHSLQLRGERFQCNEQTQFQRRPNATLTSPAFGRITGASSGRIMQVSMKYQF